jgi:hypothetical protein
MVIDMGKIALIKNGVVANVIVANIEDARLLTGYDDAVDVSGTEVGIGWLYDGQAFTPPPVDTAELKARHWDAIKQERDRRTQQGGYQVAGKWFHSDTFSRTQQMGLVMMGASIPVDLQWKTMDGSFVTMTQALAGQVFTAAAASDTALFARAEQIKSAMEDDPVNFDLASQTWPAVFGDNP